MNTSALEVALQKVVGSKMPWYIVSANNAAKRVEFDKFPIIVIQNTRGEHHRGEHWIAWLITSQETTEMMDSFGQPVSSYPFVKFPVKNITKQNRRPLQSESSNYCGLYCLHFAYHRSLGRSFESFISLYGQNRLHNDWKILNWTFKHLPLFKPDKCYKKDGKNQKCIRKCDVEIA